MREKNTGFIFWVVVFCSFGRSSSNHNGDDKSRQTFVIRYKDGEQTIPVTVVLDYKKQTEYVINMNPRTPAKSVTLYDFKQRTIAYKDLTNRECFLGRLTHETLFEEVSALQDVKNPVEGRPKVRSLDPRRPALTPTEIRNLAGQKTAVFCRKMNTWLLMPDRPHGITKREADELEERTLQYHGHRSSQYSHYERETRRRVRNRGPASNRRRPQRNKSAAENENGWPAVSEQSPHLSRGQPVGNDYLNAGFPDANHSSLSPAHQNPYFSTLRNFEGDEENANSGVSFANSLPPRRSQGEANNLGYPVYSSRLFTSSTNPPHSRSPLRASNYFDPNETNGSPVSDHEKISKDTSQYFGRKRPSEHIVADGLSSTTERTGPKDNLFGPGGQGATYPNVHPSLAHLLPVFKPLSQEFDFGKPNSLDTHPQRNIESELHPFAPSHSGQDYQFSHLTSGHNTSEDPDVSVNVLEVPRITKEFENVVVNSSYHPMPHIVGAREFPNSVENYPSVSKTYFRSPSHLQKGNASSTGNVRPGIPLDSRSDRESYSNESSILIPQPHISSTTTLPLHTTSEYFVTDRTTSSPAYVPSVHTAFQNSEDFNSFQIFPSYIQSNNPPSLERNFSAQSLHASDTKLTDGITLNRFSTTRYPLTKVERNTRPHHRSDIPSEENGGKSSSSYHAARDTYPSFINHTSNDGDPPYRKRYQSGLRDFKPDEIVIDVENIPAHTLQPITSSFQQRMMTTIQPTVRSLRPGSTERKREQISGTSWRTVHPVTRYPRRRINDKTRHPVQHNVPIVHPQRVSLNQNNYPDIRPQPEINQLIGVNHYIPPNRRQFHYPSRPHPPVQVRMPTELNHLHHFSQLNSLPPGVSMHPRHPQAPFADMVHSNRPPTIPLASDSQPELKPHRQRHHRKKDRHINSCCRLRGKSGAFQSCCRNGGPCCSLSQRRLQPSGSSCCSSSKAAGQVVPANQIQPPVRTPNQIQPPIRTEESQGSDRGNKDRCQKEKMCRTVYESTQQVMVCRNAHIEGC